MKLFTTARQLPYFEHMTACIAATLIVASLFVLLEPIVSIGASASDTFTVRQQITEEISFTVAAADVTMNGTIGGITGGSATGTTQAVVRTNSAGGYNMTVAFANDPAMLGETTGNTGIRDYGTSTAAEPTYNFNASTSAQFAYTVSASSTSDLDNSFRDNGSAICNVANVTDTANRCWKGPSTSPFTIINRTTAAGSGATTTLTFVVLVPSNPSPQLEEDFYTATATLTATTN